MAQAIKSANSKTEWRYDQGELSETGPTHPKLTRGVIDTYRLYMLLLANHEDLTARYEAAMSKGKPMKFITDVDYPEWNEDE